MSKTLSIFSPGSEVRQIEVADDFSLPLQMDGWFYINGINTRLAVPAWSVSTLALALVEELVAA